MVNDSLTNLLWIAMAMTVPENTQESFYYDAKLKVLFSAISTLDFTINILLKDASNQPLSGVVGSDIAVRLEWVDDESSEIVEVPRLNLQDKIAIQLSFLSNFEGVHFLQDLINSVENQKDDYKMVLDTVLSENDVTAPIASYWDDFKIATILEYIKQFQQATSFKFPITFSK